MTSLNCFAVISALITICSVEASAQFANQSDVTGPPTTTSDIAGGIFSPSTGTVAVPATPAASASLAAVAQTVNAAITSGSLRTRSGAPIPAAAQSQIAAVLNDSLPTTRPAAELSALLAQVGVAGMTVAALAESLTGLLSNPAPGQLAAAVGNYNEMIQSAPASLLLNPPPQLLAIQAVLARLSAATHTSG
jgi:hypothetical protein